MSDLFTEARACERFDMESITNSTTKSIYLSFTDMMPPPSIVLKHPERDFDLIFKRVNSNVFSKNARTMFYLIIHERSHTRERSSL